MSPLGFSDLAIGHRAAFETTITDDDLDRFARLSGDVSPLHMDRQFAQGRGFDDRVVHGAFLAALVSRLVGVHLPGENGLLQRLNLEFKSPVVVGRRVRVEGEVDQLSESVQVAVIRVSVTDLATGRPVAAGKAQVGFTRPMPRG